MSYLSRPDAPPTHVIRDAPVRESHLAREIADAVNNGQRPVIVMVYDSSINDMRTAVTGPLRGLAKTYFVDSETTDGFLQSLAEELAGEEPSDEYEGISRGPTPPVTLVFNKPEPYRVIPASSHKHGSGHFLNAITHMLAPRKQKPLPRPAVAAPRHRGDAPRPSVVEPHHRESEDSEMSPFIITVHVNEGAETKTHEIDVSAVAKALYNGENHETIDTILGLLKENGVHVDMGMVHDNIKTGKSMFEKLHALMDKKTIDFEKLINVLQKYQEKTMKITEFVTEGRLVAILFRKKGCGWCEKLTADVWNAGCKEMLSDELGAHVEEVTVEDSDGSATYMSLMLNIALTLVGVESTMSGYPALLTIDPRGGKLDASSIKLLSGYKERGAYEAAVREMLE